MPRRRTQPKRNFLTAEELQEAGVLQADAADAEIIAELVERFGQALFYTFLAAMNKSMRQSDAGETHDVMSLQWRAFAVMLLKSMNELA